MLDVCSFCCAVLVKSPRADVEPCWGQVVGWSWKHVGFNLGREILAEKNRGNGGSVRCGVLIQAASTTTEGCKVSAVNPNQSWSLEKALKILSRNLGLECRPRCSSWDATKLRTSWEDKNTVTSKVPSACTRSNELKTESFRQRSRHFWFWTSREVNEGTRTHFSKGKLGMHE